MNIGKIITDKRKSLGLTQQALAEKLNISFQAVSKWENGTSYPDITILPMLATTLKVSIDSLLGYSLQSLTEYDKRYDMEGYYWGLSPNHLCYEIMRLKPPTTPYKVLDIGCGEGKDAVFLARISASSRVSSSITPKRIIYPFLISEISSPSTVTLALDTL